MTIQLQHQDDNSITSQYDEPIAVKEWISKLRRSFDEISLAVQVCNESLLRLDALVTSDCDSIRLYKLFERYMAKWIEDQCIIATAAANAVGPVRLKSDDLPDDVSSFRFPMQLDRNDDRILKRDSATPEELIDYVINSFDFKLLYESVMQFQPNLQQDNYKCAANRLIERFNLYSSGRNTTVLFGVIKEKVAIDFAYYGHRRSKRIEEFKWLSKLAQVFEHETGCVGLSDCMMALATAESAYDDVTKDDAMLPSRKRINEHGNVQAVVYNGKIKFHFSLDVFEAFIGFIKTYGSRETVSVTIQKSN